MGRQPAPLEGGVVIRRRRVVVRVCAGSLILVSEKGEDADRSGRRDCDGYGPINRPVMRAQATQDA